MAAGIAQRIIDRIDEDVLRDLRDEDPSAAIGIHFGPVQFQPLPASDAGGPCSTDGYYLHDVHPPAICFVEEVAAARLRFTLLHELGHHLIATTCQDLLDDIDRLGDRFADGATYAEELVCHRFASGVLIPQSALPAVSHEHPLTPEHVRAVHDATNASWEATAVRCAELIVGGGAVVLMRWNGSIGFCASSGLGSGWMRGSWPDPNGALSKSVRLRQTSLPETYRYGLPYARGMFCDTLPIDELLGVAVLASKSSDRHFEILEEVEPAWRARESWCERCQEERSDGWCYTCSGRLCPKCERCACDKPVDNPLCGVCFLRKPQRADASCCVDCE